MAGKRNTSRKKKKTTPGKSARHRNLVAEIVGLGLLFWAAFLFLSLFSYAAADPHVNLTVSRHYEVQNLAGLMGSHTAGLLVVGFGLGAYFWPLLCLYLGIFCFVRRIGIDWWRWLGITLLWMSAMVLFTADWAFPKAMIGEVQGGGFTGLVLTKWSQLLLRKAGSMLLWIFTLIIGLQLTFGLSWRAIGKRTGARATDQWLKYKERAQRRKKVKAATPAEAGILTAAVMEEEIAEEAMPLEQTAVPLELPSDIDTSDQDMYPDVLPEPETSQEIPDYLSQAAPIDEPDVYADENEPYPAAPAPAMHENEESGAKASDDDLPWFMRDDVPIPQQVLDPNDTYGEIPFLKELKEEADGPNKEGYPFMDEEELSRPVSPAPAPAPAASNDIEHITPVDTFEENHPVEAQPFATQEVPEAAIPAIPSLPPLDYLVADAVDGTEVNMDELQRMAESLTESLADFGVKGEVLRIIPGPVVTMFQYKPAPGIKISRIAGLSDDLALAMRALAVRIDTVPGKDVVGIEIPNFERQTVFLRDIFESDAFNASDSKLTLALGKDIRGDAFATDLAKMPHMLVAGATGAGKSVCLNCILVSMLYKAGPDDVKLLLVDPKRIELSAYSKLPHLVHPVVTEMAMAKSALDWAVHEMDQRYQAMATLGVRNIASYNKKLPTVDTDERPEVAGLEKMPYLVIVIDELADLMMTAGKEAEMSIVRLAQLARAAGIHLILATQRPSVDVVTGLIKANFPTRLAFQVTSKHDSRTILDAVGAERLLGRGDSLFKPGGGRPLRIHGAYVSDEEIASVVHYWAKQRPQRFNLDFADWQMEQDGAPEGEPGGMDDDPKYREAVDFIMQQGKASISMIQRRFRIGFNKAARYIEQMEADGLLGPQEGSKPRQVLKSLPPDQ